MSTIGQIRMRLTQLHPGMGSSLDLLDGWIFARNQEALDTIEWRRQDVERAIVTEVEYNTGTVSVTNGSASITGDGTTWTSAMTGRIIRINGEADYYGFTRVSNTTATLDREYAGETASDLTYRLNKSIYVMDQDVRMVHGVRSARYGPLGKHELNDIAPGRNEYGSPRAWSLFPDAQTDPPLIQIEVFPVPTETESLYLSLAVDVDSSEVGETSASLLPWVRPQCIIEGVEADICAHLAEQEGRNGNGTAASSLWQASQRHEQRFQKLLSDMRRIAGAEMGPQRMRMDSRYTRHQGKRYGSDAARYRHGWS